MIVAVVAVAEEVDGVASGMTLVAALRLGGQWL
jgi:hypothetical protein